MKQKLQTIFVLSVVWFLLSGLVVDTFVVAPTLESSRASYAQAKETPSESLSEPNKATSEVEMYRNTAKPTQKEIKSYIKEVFKENWGRAYQISRCESRLNPNAINRTDAKINGTPSYGIFQISAGVHGYNPETLLNYKKNIDIAYKLYQESGWIPWRLCSKKLDIL